MQKIDDLYTDLIYFDVSDAQKFIFQDVDTYAKVYKVYDGDTISIVFKFKDIFLRDSCRLYGIDTPEISRCTYEEKVLGYEAKYYLENLILNQIIRVEFLNFDKYGRPLINIYLLDDNNTCINDLLVEKGYARVYTGKKEPWV